MMELDVPSAAGSVSVRRVAPLLIAVSATTSAACGPPAPTEDGAGWVGTMTTDGNVTTVVTDSGSVWNGPVTLVEETSTNPPLEPPRMFCPCFIALDGAVSILDGAA